MSDAIKNPNGYGSIYKLGGKCRKLYTVRLTEGCDTSDDWLIQHRITLSQLYDRWSEMHYKQRIKRCGHTRRYINRS